MSRGLVNILLLLGLVLGGATACGNETIPVDEGTPAPAAFISPVDNKPYCAWVNNPHECDDSEYDAAPFAMPSNDLDRSTQGVNDDYALLNALLSYHIMYHAFFNNAWYYDNYIGPAWDRYPGTYNAWRGHPVVRVTNVNFYVTNSRHFDNRYRERERTSAASAQYRTKTGKVYNGKNVPRKRFTGTNAKPTRAGNAPRAGKKPTSVTPSNASRFPSSVSNKGNNSGKDSGKDKSRPGAGAKPKPGGGKAPHAVPKPKPPAPKPVVPKAPAPKPRTR